MQTYEQYVSLKSDQIVFSLVVVFIRFKERMREFEI